MNPEISVLTVPRRPQYLEGTLRAIDAAGAAQFEGKKTVYVDGPATGYEWIVPLTGWVIDSLHRESRGTRPSLWQILHRAALAGAPYLLHFEDDIRLCRNAIAAMAAIDVPPAFGFLSFFQQNAGMPDTPGFHGLPPGRTWWGAQALKVPARSLHRFKKDVSAPPENYRSGECDVWLGDHLRGGVLLPSIVRHIGEESAIPTQKGERATGHRAGLQYAGDDFDAGSLIERAP